MGNRKRGYKPNSRTRQKRAAAIREWELENLEDDVDAGEPVPSRADTASAAPRSMLSRIFTVEKRPATRAERNETPWSRRGLLTMSLIAAVVAIPLGAVLYFGENPQQTGSPHHSFALWVVATFGPAQSIPLFNVALSCLVAMPLARALSREPRNLRILEVLGYAAVVQILVYVLWSPVTTVNDWAYSGGAILMGGIADIAALVAAAFVYPRVQSWLMRRTRRPR